MKKSSLFLLSMLCASVALAEPPAQTPPNKAQEAASALVKKQLLQPLKKAESRRSKFSRAAPVPAERRVRVLDPVALTDVHGKQFVRFAVDARYPYDEDRRWEKNVFVGCAYLDQEEVFLERGKDYVPATSAIGGDRKPRPDVCRPAPADAAQVASAAR